MIFESARVLNEGGVLGLNVDNSKSAPGLCEYLLEIAGGIMGSRNRSGAT